MLSIFTQIEGENKVVNEQKCKKNSKISPAHIHKKKKKETTINKTTQHPQ
jgi:hypothetical protein